jgi:hypothetical protein
MGQTIGRWLGNYASLEGKFDASWQLHPFWQRYVYIIEGNGAFSK